MRKILFLLIPVLFIFYGCDGKSDSNKSSAKLIESMKLTFGSLEKNLVFKNDSSAVELPAKTSLEAVLTFSLSAKSILKKAEKELKSGDKITFENGKSSTFSVIAEDNSTKSYVITVNLAKEQTPTPKPEEPKKDTKSIELLNIRLHKTKERIPSNIQDKDITITLPAGTNLAKDTLILELDQPTGYKSKPANGDTIKLVAGTPLEIQVTKPDESKETYRLIASVAASKRTTTEISTINLTFTDAQALLGGSAMRLTAVVPKIDHKAGTIVFNLPYTTDSKIENVEVPYTVETKDGGTTNKTDKIKISYTETTTVKVTAEDGTTTKDYTISFVKLKSHLNKFVSLKFTINGQDYSPNLSLAKDTIRVPAGTAISSVMPTFTLPANATASITSGTIITDFVKGQHKVVTVTAHNGAVYTYNYTIVEAKPDVKNLQNLVLKMVGGSTINPTGFNANAQGTHIVDVSYAFAYGTNLSTAKFKLTATLQDTKSKLKQGSTVITNDLTEITLVAGDNVLTIEAQDGSTQTTTLKITVDPGSDAKDILTFKATNSSDVAHQVSISGQNISIEVPTGTDVSAVKVTTTISANATKSIADGTLAFTLGTAKDLVITSQRGTTKTYKVTVTANDSYKITATRTTGRLLSYKDVSVNTFENGDPTTTTNGKTYSITYGSNNFIQTIKDGTTTWTYFYDLYNRVYKMTKAAFSTTTYYYFYDTTGKIVNSEEHSSSGLKYTYKYIYDSGKLKTRTRITVSSRSTKSYAYAFDANGNLTQYGTSALSAYDNKKNPYLNLFPKAYIDIVDDPYYRSPNNAATYKTTTHTNLQYTANEFLSSKEITARKNLGSFFSAKWANVKTTTTYTYE